MASIEARMGSSRLPGKVLMDVAGRPALDRLVERLRAVPSLDDVVLATTTSPGDDALEDWAAQAGVACHRGSEEDVLQRVVDAQTAAGGEIVVEVTGDCTLLCPDVIELGIETFLANDCDVVSNCGRVQTFPLGADVQVFPLALLADVAERIDDLAVREHVSLHFYESPDYRVINLVAPETWRVPGARLQLDYPEDHAFIEAVLAELEPVHGPVFGLAPLAALLRARPDIVAINRDCEEKAPR
ncbi:MAG: glycosyltransferase family protein [Alphaproteobacteria bacterium]|nr:glycosyltransferase family protein [Alphaproteobacteria bacterium]